MDGNAIAEVVTQYMAAWNEAGCRGQTRAA